jgi:hypothetical protein
MSIARNLSGMVGFLGAGVYEELLFRLMLLPAGEWSWVAASILALAGLLSEQDILVRAGQARAKAGQGGVS